MFQKPNKSQYGLLISSLVFLVSYYIFWRSVNLAQLADHLSTNLSILLVILPVLLISTGPSYVLLKLLKIKNQPLVVKLSLFCLIYIIVAFLSVAILIAMGL